MSPSRLLALSLVFALPCAMFAACVSDPDKAPPLSDLEGGPLPDRPFIPPPDTGGDTNQQDTSMIQDTGPDTLLSCHSDEAGCNDAAVCGTKVFELVVKGTLPPATGGDVADGTYVLTNYASYSTIPPFGMTTTWYRKTLVIKGSRIERIDEDSTGTPLSTASIDFTYELADGAPAVDAAPPPSDAGDGGDAADATPAPGGSYMAFNTSYACGQTGLGGVPYSVSGSKLIINLPGNQKPSQLTFVKQ